MSWCTRNGTRPSDVVDELGIREHLEEVPARRVEDVEVATRSLLDHLFRRQAGPVADGEAVLLAERGRRLGCDGDTARKRGRVRAHLGAALYA